MLIQKNANIQKPCKYHTNTIQISCKYHSSIIQIPYKYHANITQISSKYQANITILAQWTFVPGPAPSLLCPRFVVSKAPAMVTESIFLMRTKLLRYIEVQVHAYVHDHHHLLHHQQQHYQNHHEGIDSVRNYTIIYWGAPPHTATVTTMKLSFL